MTTGFIDDPGDPPTDSQSLPPSRGREGRTSRFAAPERRSAYSVTVPVAQLLSIARN